MYKPTTVTVKNRKLSAYKKTEIVRIIFSLKKSLNKI